MVFDCWYHCQEEIICQMVHAANVNFQIKYIFNKSRKTTWRGQQTGSLRPDYAEGVATTGIQAACAHEVHVCGMITQWSPMIQSSVQTAGAAGQVMQGPLQIGRGHEHGSTTPNTHPNSRGHGGSQTGYAARNGHLMRGHILISPVEGTGLERTLDGARVRRRERVTKRVR